MQSLPSSRPRTRSKSWWREVRAPQIERQADALIKSFEAKQGQIPGCVVDPSLIVSEVGCEMVYFSDEERPEYRIPPDAIGALKPAQRLIFIYEDIGLPGREGLTIGEEIGHWVLHTRQPAETLESGSASGLEDEGGVPTFFRTESRGYVRGEVEPPWMSREAMFFAACLQMPRDRYGSVVRRKLIEDLTYDFRRGIPRRSLTQEVAAVMELLASGDRDLDGWDRAEYTDNGLIEWVLVDLPLGEPKYYLSLDAQRRRLVELGLAHDAADLLPRMNGRPAVPRHRVFFLKEQVVEQAWRDAGRRDVS